MRFALLVIGVCGSLATASHVPITLQVPDDALLQPAGWRSQLDHLSNIAQRHLQVVSTDAPESYSDLDALCTAMEEQFYHPVSCDCVGALHSATLSFSCTYRNPICGPLNRTCGQPQMAATLVQGQVFSASTCVSDYQDNVRQVSYKDTCVSIEMCDTYFLGGGPCSCQASYGTQVCQSCELCDDGIQYDCSNVNADAVTTGCRKLDNDLDLAGGAGFLAGFLPDFAGGFCSQLEEGVSDRIRCDCTNSGGGTFDVACATRERNCHGLHCGDVASTVFVENGAIAAVDTCVDYALPVNWRNVCTRINVCEDGSVCSCAATYDGQVCASCSLCDGGVHLDCSNVEPLAMTDTCQPVSMETVYEFLPDFAMPHKTSGAGRIGSSAIAMMASMMLLAV